ncbi:glycosyltransferase family 4 protein [Leptolyngbya sp. BC1307]|uniref:glycosyltransferase family 4 protein n=1 Tax=Leptolyngbya sp. BC1307 TaxID=2029589 RepID=UPI000EFA4F6B|nr:glycosyltransferase family 4 protein [Leptolyngbya sp. BC1307]
MKALLVNTYDISGGAARAAYRLHQGLNQLGVTSQMLVQDKQSKDPAVLLQSQQSSFRARLRNGLDSSPVRLYGRRERTIFSPHWLPSRNVKAIDKLSPDVVNLHWVSHAYLQIEALARLKYPLVWTLHDMWAFTGGCHYAGDCKGYEQSCGRCPILNSGREKDLSHWIWQRKHSAWQNLNLTIVTPSRWLGECARASTLFQDCRVEVIPNGLDPQRYQPAEKSLARSNFNLPSDKRLVLFGAMNAIASTRKGYQFLQPALQHLSRSGWQDNLELVVFGSSGPAESQPDDLGFKVNYLGHLKDEAIALAYAACDVFVAPSVQENLSNTVMEALACGTPCLAFRIGGMPDMIEHLNNGYLANPYDIQDLAQGVAWIVEDPERQAVLSRSARLSVEQAFTVRIQAQRYKTLFESLKASV